MVHVFSNPLFVTIAIQFVMGIKSRGCRCRWSICSVVLALLVMPRASGFSSPPVSGTHNICQQWRDRSQAHNFSSGRNDANGKLSVDFSLRFSVQNPAGSNRLDVTGDNTPCVKTLCASVVLGLLVVGAPLDANAGFGPSSGATTSSPPNLVAPSVQDRDIEYNAKKLKQLIGSTLDEKRLQEFSIQLGELAESLRNLLAADDEAEGDETQFIDMTIIRSRDDREDELEKARILQNQILEREKVLRELETQPYWFNYLAALIGSVASTLVMHPVDTIKTRLQVNSSGRGRREDKTILTLYDGLAGNILKEGPPSALYLGVYESVKYSLLPLFGPQYKLWIYLASGAAGELVGSVVRGPAEAVKSTVQSGIASSASEAAMEVFGTAERRNNVVRAWSASVWRDVPFGAIQIALFELIKAYILNNPDIDFDSSTTLFEALIGAFAGGCGALLTNPFDVITTRIITQSVADEEGGDTKPLGVVGMGKRVYEEGGLAAFTVGWQARTLYWAPAISIFLSCYCSVRQAGVEHGWFS